MFRWFRKPELTLLLLCSANVCRSPAAEGLLRDALNRRGLTRRVQVMSAGTEVSTPGVPPDPRMVAIARESGLRLQSLRSRPLTPELLATVDVVYGMEQVHLDCASALRGDTEAPEILLLDPDGSPIDDPYFGDKAGVRRAFEQLATAAERRAEDAAQRLNATSGPDC